MFTDICKTAGECDEILFNPDGSWAPLGAPSKDAQTVGSKVNGQKSCPPAKVEKSQSQTSKPAGKVDVAMIVILAQLPLTICQRRAC